MRNNAAYLAACVAAAAGAILPLCAEEVAASAPLPAAERQAELKDLIFSLLRIPSITSSVEENNRAVRVPGAAVVGSYGEVVKAIFNTEEDK